MKRLKQAAVVLIVLLGVVGMAVGTGAIQDRG
jgi:hypothetical protein